MAETSPRTLGEHRYALTSTWTGNTGTGTTGYRDYRRDVTIEIEGKPDLLASADKPFRGDASRWNPEDLLLASLSECHLLSYLHACVTAGVVVVSYRDRATGMMREDGAGGGSFVEVMLPPVKVSVPPVITGFVTLKPPVLLKVIFPATEFVPV